MSSKFLPIDSHTYRRYSHMEDKWSWTRENHTYTRDKSVYSSEASKFVYFCYVNLPSL